MKKRLDDKLDDLKFKATEELLGADKDNAVAENEVDTERDRDARSLALKNLELSKNIKEGKVDT